MSVGGGFMLCGSRICSWVSLCLYEKEQRSFLKSEITTSLGNMSKNADRTKLKLNKVIAVSLAVVKK